MMSSRSEKRLPENLPAIRSAENAVTSPEISHPDPIGPKSARPEFTGPEFTLDQRRILLGLARAAVASGLAG